MNLFDFFKFFSLAHSEIAENGAGKVLSSEEENSSVHKTYVNFPTSRKSALNVPLYAISSGRNERPKNGADAKPCLSDVYKSGTRARRRQVDAALCGRSMVEMLGVLAIIGVLSVGAISGYSKAMMKYKLNKQAEQLSWLFNIIYQYKGQFVYDKKTSMIPLFTKLNLIDQNMIHADKKETIYDSFGNAIAISNNNGPTFNEIILNMNLPKSSSNRLAICQNVFNVAKAHSPYLLYIRTDNRESQSEPVTPSDKYYGDNHCKDWGNGVNCIRYATLENIYNVCQNCDEMPICYFSITWRI